MGHSCLKVKNLEGKIQSLEYLSFPAYPAGRFHSLMLSMLTQKSINFFLSTLATMYPDNTTELVWETPWQLLIAVVMSAQTTDKQVNKVTAKFFDTIKTPYDTLTLTEKQWASCIAGVNYAPTKAKNLYKTAQILVNQSPVIKENLLKNKKELITKEKSLTPFSKGGLGGLKIGYTIPSSIPELIKLPGIGEKTAKVIAHVLYQAPVIAVDTHVHRVSNRIGLASTKLPLQTSRLLDTVIPEKYKITAHHGMVMFGRYHCTARKPKCDSCPFTSFCKYYKEVVKK